MNIHEAAKSGKPFRHPKMIGAWAIIDGTMVHRDHTDDFKNLNLIEAHDNDNLYWMSVNDLLRTDWETIG